jgi:hypothetical protein
MKCPSCGGSIFWESASDPRTAEGDKLLICQRCHPAADTEKVKAIHNFLKAESE